ncbi:MAG: SEC-C metal-binding domain-containing protein [Fuerstiella sp.]
MGFVSEVCKLQKVLQDAARQNDDSEFDETPFTIPDLEPLLSRGVNRQTAMYLVVWGQLAGLETVLEESDAVSTLRHAVEVARGEDDPEDLPDSPICDTVSTLWALCDLRTGPGQRSAGEMILELLKNHGATPRFLKACDALVDSRLGIYEEIGEVVTDEGNFLNVRELVTQRELLVYTVTGYRGSPGDLRLTRLGPPLTDDSAVYTELTTPAALEDVTVVRWTRYLEEVMPASVPRADGTVSTETQDRLASVFKNDPGAMAWLQFIWQGYHGHQDDVIFLSGIPNDPETLPQYLPEFHQLGGDFDIHADVYDDYGEIDEDRCDRYVEMLWERFAGSPEFASLPVDDHYAVQCVTDLGISHLGVTPAAMTLPDLREVLFEIVPGMVFQSAEWAPTAIAELNAFFRFLHREFKIEKAGELADFLNQDAVDQLAAELADQDKSGMAKSFFEAGTRAGFDMTCEEGLNSFVAQYSQMMVDDLMLADDEDPEDDDEPMPSQQQPVTIRNSGPRAGRNDPCPCGSGRKYKKCCLKSDVD